MGEVDAELRRLRRAVAQAERRLALAELRGHVAEVDAQKRKVRVEIGTSADGTPVLSPWVSWAEPSNGILKIAIPMQVGDPVVVRSPSGVLGTASVAERQGYSTAHPAPSNAADTVVERMGEVEIVRTADSLEIRVGGTRVRISAAGLELTGGKLKHDGINVGKDHKHTDVLAGGSRSGPPAQD